MRYVCHPERYTVLDLNDSRHERLGKRVQIYLGILNRPLLTTWQKMDHVPLAKPRGLSILAHLVLFSKPHSLPENCPQFPGSSRSRKHIDGWPCCEYVASIEDLVLHQSIKFSHCPVHGSCRQAQGLRPPCILSKWLWTTCGSVASSRYDTFYR